MVDKFWKRKKKKLPEGDEWITVPFRVAEAARVSIYTIGSRPELPEPIRWWIAQWLTNYNAYLVTYLQDTYGPDIFPLLDKITQDVVPDEDKEVAGGAEPNTDTGRDSWELWEKQLDDLEGP